MAVTSPGLGWPLSAGVASPGPAAPGAPGDRMMNDRSARESARVSGLLGLLSPGEGTITKAILAGKDPAQALASVKGLPAPRGVERREVDRALASERVRRTIAGVLQGRGGVRGEEVRAFVFERLVDESLDAREGGVRIAAIKMLGELPGVDAWKPRDERDANVAEAGARLGEVLAAVEARLTSTVVDAVQPGPDALADDMRQDDGRPHARQEDGQEGGDDMEAGQAEPLDPWG